MPVNLIATVHKHGVIPISRCQDMGTLRRVQRLDGHPFAAELRLPGNQDLAAQTFFLPLLHHRFCSRSIDNGEDRTVRLLLEQDDEVGGRGIVRQLDLLAAVFQAQRKTLCPALVGPIGHNGSIAKVVDAEAVRMPRFQHLLVKIAAQGRIGIVRGLIHGILLLCNKIFGKPRPPLSGFTDWAVILMGRLYTKIV